MTLRAPRTASWVPSDAVEETALLRRRTKQHQPRVKRDSTTLFIEQLIPEDKESVLRLVFPRAIHMKRMVGTWRRNGANPTCRLSCRVVKPTRCGVLKPTYSEHAYVEFLREKET